MKKNLQYVFGLGILIMVLVKWILIPSYNKMIFHKQDVVILENMVIDKIQQLETLDQMQDKIKDLANDDNSTNRFVKWKKTLAPKESFPNILFQSVEIKNKAKNKKAAELFYPVEIRLQGNYDQLGYYLIYLESSLSSFLYIDTLNMFPSFEGENLICVNLNGKIIY